MILQRALNLPVALAVIMLPLETLLSEELTSGRLSPRQNLARAIGAELAEEPGSNLRRNLFEWATLLGYPSSLSPGRLEGCAGATLVLVGRTHFVERSKALSPPLLGCPSLSLRDKTRVFRESTTNL